jgi:hypothetical protein
MASPRISHSVWLCPLLALWLSGCGTTRWTDTRRTATEQMLVSDAIDRAVSRIDFRLLAGKEVFLDTAFLGEAVDKEYLTSTLRQQMVSSGCILKEKREQAAFIVEARAGTIGTDRHDLLYGVPGFSLPTFASPVAGAPALPSTFPEVALAKRTDQQAVAKIAVFAYHRETGAPIWQSGADVVASKARDLWVLGAGPFQHGMIYDHPQFAGDEFHVPLVDGNQSTEAAPAPVRVSQQRLFNTPEKFPTKIAAAPSTVDPSVRLMAQPFEPDSRLQPPPVGQPPTMEPAWDKVEMASPLDGTTLK